MNAGENPPYERKMVSIPDHLARLIDDYRFGNRIPTEAEAIRQVLELGLEKARQLGKLPKESGE